MDNETPDTPPTTLHLNFGDRAEDVELNMPDLSDEQLRALWDTYKLQEARLELRERTGFDPAVTLSNQTSEDVAWFVDWVKRHPEFTEKAKEEYGTD